MRCGHIMEVVLPSYLGRYEPVQRNFPSYFMPYAHTLYHSLPWIKVAERELCSGGKERIVRVRHGLKDVCSHLPMILPTYAM